MKLFNNLKQWQGGVFAVGKGRWWGEKSKTKHGSWDPSRLLSLNVSMDAWWTKGKERLGDGGGENVTFPAMSSGSYDENDFLFPNSAILFIRSRGWEGSSVQAIVLRIAHSSSFTLCVPGKAPSLSAISPQCSAVNVLATAGNRRDKGVMGITGMG